MQRIPDCQYIELLLCLRIDIRAATKRKHHEELFIYIHIINYMAHICGGLDSVNMYGQGQVLTCYSVYSWRLHSAVPLGGHVMSTMIPYLTQSHYHETVLTSHCPIILLLSARLGDNKLEVIGLTQLSVVCVGGGGCTAA